MPRAPASFSVSANGAATYQWQQASGSSWVNIPGATGPTYSIPSTSVTANNLYRCQITGPAPCYLSTTSASAVITFYSLVQYNVGTNGNTAICPGNTTEIVLSSSHPGTTYNLYRNGVSYSSEKSQAEGPLSWTVNAGGTYTVTGVTEEGCEIPMYGSAVINVFSESLAATSVTNSSPTICPGDSSVLTATGGSLGTEAGWKWYANNENSAPVFTGNPYTVTPSSTTTYYVKAVGICNTTSAVSSVVNVTTPPSITQQPESITVCPGAPASFSVSANGAATYQWQQASGSSWVNITGATNQTLNIASTSATANNLFRCLITGPAPCYLTTTSASAVITFYSIVQYTLGTEQNSAICPGNTAIITLGSSHPGTTYNLYRNGVVYSSEKSQAEGPLSWTVNAGGTYTATGLTEEGCEIPMIGSAIITARYPSTPPGSISATAGSICPGESSTLTINGGSLEEGYGIWKWRSGTGTCGSVSEGENMTSISVTPSVTTTYYAFAEGGCITTPCASVTVTVKPMPNITMQPVNSTVALGQNVSFSVTATGPNLLYQWQTSLNGDEPWVDLTGSNESGYNTSTLIILGSADFEDKFYRCRISSDCNTVTSNGAKIVLVFPASNYLTGSNIPDPETRILNTDLLVGSTKASLNTGAAGGTSYTVPLDVPPGIGGLVPELSLVYSSSAGPGLPGYGWQIAGLSSISRGSWTFYNDGSVKGIEMTQADRLYLDGQRLVNTTGTYGDANAQYQTEYDIFTRVTPQATDANGSSWFKAETKSGLIFEYGNIPSSKQRISGYPGILNWYVSKVRDLFGNEINFKYIQDHSSVYPSQITYGPNEILFYYKDRTDKNYFCIKGAKIEQWLLLDKIVIKYNSGIVKTYELKQSCPSSSYNSYSVLNEIIEYGIGTDRLNSNAFSYEFPENASFSQTTYNNTHTYVNYSSRLVTGDFNGDGKTDFLCLADASKGATWTGMRFYFSDGNDNFTNYIENSTSIDVSQLKDIHSVDLNADGIQDIVYELSDGYSSVFYYMLCNGITITTPTLFYNQSGFVDIMLGRSRRVEELQEDDNVISGEDYNGDGANDIFINHPDGTWIIKSFVNSSGEMTSSLNTIGSGFLSTLASAEILNGDFDGDGKPEIWCFGDNDLKIYSFDGTNLNLLFTTSLVTRKHFFNLGDFNGDGKVDIFMYGFGRKQATEYDWADWQIRLSTGTTFETKPFPQKKANLKDDYVRSSDFNGDGMSDIMVTSANLSWNGTYFYITKNHGTDLQVHNIPNYPYASHNFSIGDFNGDGNADFICTDGVADWWTGYQVYKSVTNNSILMNKVADGSGLLSKIKYVRLSEATPEVYQKGTQSPAYPVLSYQIPFNVVESVRIDNGIGSKNTQTYYYEGAMIHLQGKGFLGFSKFRSKDDVTGLENETVSGYSNTYFYPKVLNNITRLSSGSQVIRQTGNTYSEIVLDASGKRIFPYIQSSTESDLLTGLGTASTFQYDSYGNPLSVEKLFGGSHFETTTNTYDNVANSEKWLIGRPGTTTVQYTKTGYSTITRSVNRSFDQGNNHLLSETRFPGTDKESTKYYFYFPSGNFKKDSVVAGGVYRVSRVSYETDNIRLHSSTDVLSHTSTNSYDTYGRLHTKQDYLGNIMTFQYDNLNRQISASASDGGQTSVVYNWEDTLSIPLKGRYSILKTNNDGSQIKEWYDKLGRLLRSDTKGFDGTMVYTSNVYNAKGQIESVSDPYYSGSTALWNTYSYDDYGRKTGLLQASGRNTTWEYENNSVTETSGSRSSTKTYSSDGTMASATDPGGSITYNYYPDGKVKDITAPGGIITSMQYDIAGNQVQLADPSAGTITYSYNAFGELTGQVNPGSQNISVQYYSDGRMYKKTVHEGIIKYRYNVNKELANISYPGGVSKSFGYDSNGRMTTITDTIPGTSPLVTSLGYDGLGRQNTVTHPSGIVETSSYNTNGYGNSVSSGGTVRWTVNTFNARGQVTSGVYGSSLNTTFGYDEYGYPETISAGTIQSYSYNFDHSTGNLTWRSDNIHTLRENFHYDDLDRLDSVYMNGIRTLKMSYGSNSGLESKSDAGTFQYSGERPYALSGIDPSTGLISTEHTLTFTSSQSVNTIDENGYHADFLYRDGDDRAKMTIINNGENLLTRYYSSGSYIREVSGSTTKEFTFIGGDAYSAPVVAITQSGTTVYYYLLRDHSGSITQVVNSTDNGLAAEYSYDAWGRMRNPSTWETYTPGSEPSLMIAGRGYTGHEHLPWFSLVNMNGRVYDPLIGMFVSPDNYLQNPDFSQNFNRYSYCLNNPLKHTDPSGDFFFIIPNVSWSPQAGLDVSLTVGLGFPKYASVQTTIGYSQGNFYGSVSASLGGWTGYAGYGTKSGWFTGINYNFNPLSFNFNSNIFSIGINYSQNGGFSGSYLGAQVSSAGVSFDPSLGFSHTFSNEKYFFEVNDGLNLKGPEMSENQVEDEFMSLTGVGEGEINIRDITTDPGRGYVLTGDHLFAESVKEISYGYVKPIRGLFKDSYDVHIAPYATRDIYFLRSTIIHEFTHVAQNYSGRISHLTIAQSELEAGGSAIQYLSSLPPSVLLQHKISAMMQVQIRAYKSYFK